MFLVARGAPQFREPGGEGRGRVEPQGGVRHGAGALAPRYGVDAPDRLVVRAQEDRDHLVALPELLAYGPHVLRVAVVRDDPAPVDVDQVRAPRIVGHLHGDNLLHRYSPPFHTTLYLGRS